MPPFTPFPPLSQLLSLFCAPPLKLFPLHLFRLMMFDMVFYIYFKNPIKQYDIFQLLEECGQNQIEEFAVIMKGVIELGKGSYHLVEEIGRGASAQVWLVSRLEEHKEEDKEMMDVQDKWKTQYIKTQDCFSSENNKKREEYLKTIPISQHKKKEDQSIDKAYLKEQQTRRQSSSLDKPPATVHVQENASKAQLFAVKTTTIDPTSPQAAKLEYEYWLEVDLLGALHHPGIVSLIDNGTTFSSSCYTEENEPHETNQLKYLHAVMQWAPAGTLLRLVDLIQERDHFFRQKQKILKYYCAQMISIVGYLQEQGISHRDIKVKIQYIGQAQNFVLSSDYKLKLIDFGFAEVFQCKCQDLKKYFKSGDSGERGYVGYVGSKHYISPELIKKYRDERQKYSQLSGPRSSHLLPSQHHSTPIVSLPNLYSKTDIWSLGVLIFYLFTRKYPFEGSNTYYIIEEILKGEVNYDLIDNQDIVILLRSIFKKDVKERADISTIKESQYFKGVDFEKIFQIQSPLIGISKNQGQQYHFRGEALVRIDGESRRRVVGLVSKTSKIDFREPGSQTQTKVFLEKRYILANQFSTKELDIQKQVSEKTSGSDKKISSQKKLPSEQQIQTRQRQISTRKMYLSIAKPQTNAIPKQLQITEEAMFEVISQGCRLKGLKVVSSRVEEPKSVELRFKTSEQFDHFYECYRAMIQFSVQQEPKLKKSQSKIAQNVEFMATNK